MDKKLLEIYDLIKRDIQNNRMDTLVSLKAHEKYGVGIEGWFKVEIVRILNNTPYTVERIRNEGPDLEFKDGWKIELKGATDFNADYFVKSLKQNTRSLILGQSSKKNLNELEISLKDKAKKLNININFKIHDLGQGWFIACLEEEI